jgi:hypothetical protein
MSSRGVFLIPFTCLVVFGAWALADAKVDRREKLETAIPEGVRLLEAKEYATFIKHFAEPDQLKKATRDTSLEAFAKEFGQEKAAILLKVLKSIKDTKPAFSADGKKATYNLKDDVAGKKTITFVKVDKYWYIQN